jgi:hypothetical protein
LRSSKHCILLRHYLKISVEWLFLLICESLQWNSLFGENLKKNR